MLNKVACECECSLQRLQTNPRGPASSSPLPADHCHCLITRPYRRQSCHITHTCTHVHTLSAASGKKHDKHRTQLPFYNCHLSAVVVVKRHLIEARCAAAQLHYQSLGNDMTIYGRYLSTYPIVAIVQSQNGQLWLETL